MRVSNIYNISFTNSTKPNQQKQIQSQEKKGLNNSAKLALGVGGSIALGAATYFIFRKKPDVALCNPASSKPRLNKNIAATLANLKSEIEDLSNRVVTKLKSGKTKVEFIEATGECPIAIRDILLFDKAGNLETRVVSKFDTKTQNAVHYIYKGDASQITEMPEYIDNSFFVKKIEVENFTPIMNDSLMQNITITHADNTQTQYQDFYRKAKIYERCIYNNELGKMSDSDRVIRYNFAYNNGEVVAIAKHDVYRDGQRHGMYSDNGFEPFPIYVRKIDEKEYKALKDIYTFDALCNHDKCFNPKNM